MKLHPADPKELASELLQAFSAQNALLTAGDRKSCNTMTIGWCQTGRLWNLPVCTVYVRPERYTYQFMEDQDYFTVSVLPEGEKKTMALCGSRSGRDIDKVKECGFTVRAAECGAPYFEEAELVLVCRKRFAQPMDPDNMPQEIKTKWYPEEDYHTLYIGEIVEVLVKD